MRILLSGLACALALCFVTDLAVADPATAGPGYPPPGGVSWNGTGSAIQNQAVWTYSGLDTNAYGDLYFALREVPFLGTAVGGESAMSLVSWGGTTARWENTVQLVSAVTAPSTYLGRLTMEVLGAAGASPPGSNGTNVLGAAGPNWRIPGTGFQARFRYELIYLSGPSYGSGPAGLIYDRVQNRPGDQLQTDFWTGFYWNAPVQGVPEPGTMALALMGLGGLVFVRRRRRA